MARILRNYPRIRTHAKISFATSWTISGLFYLEEVKKAVYSASIHDLLMGSIVAEITLLPPFFALFRRRTSTARRLPFLARQLTFFDRWCVVCLSARSPSIFGDFLLSSVLRQPVDQFSGHIRKPVPTTE